MLKRTAKHYQPPENLNTAAWADKYRILPKTAAESGRWNTDRTPWLRAIWDAIDNPQYKQIIVWTASQNGKTELILNYIGKRMMLDPVPMIYFGPDKDNVTEISQERLSPMLDLCPELTDALAKGQKNRTFKKILNGAPIYLGWASSASQLASKPAAIIFVDERSRMTRVGKEGDPVTIGEGRGASFPNFTTVVVSTVTEGLVSERTNPDTKLTYLKFPETMPDPTADLWRTGTRQEWAIPCQSCQQYFIPRASLFNIINNNPETAAITCPHCGSLMDEVAKTSANAHGQFINGKYQRIDTEGNITGQIPYNSTASFWASGLVSMFPGGSLQARADKLIKAKQSGDIEKQKAVQNVQLGELWASKADKAIKPEQLEKLIGDYAPEVPHSEIQGITMGIDLGDNDMHYVIRGWGQGTERTSWLLEQGILYGDTTKTAIYDRIEKISQKTYQGIPIIAVAIDSGHNTIEVYEHCGREISSRVFPIKGEAVMKTTYRPAKIEYSRQGQTLKNSIILWHLNTDWLKQWLHKRFKRPAGTEGSWNLHNSTPPEYLAQIASETRHIDDNGKPEWKKTGANHYFDCEVYALAAALKEDIASMPIAQRQTEPSPQTDTETQAHNTWIQPQEKWI